MNRYIGIDPGASGGFAMLELAAGAKVCKMPDTERDIWDWFNDTDLVGLIHKPVPRFAVIERVQGYIGKSPTTGSAMFSFGQNYGSLRMALIAARIPFEEVAPNVWQKAMGLPQRGKDEKKSAHKNRLRARAQQLFPELTVTLAVADALLLAEFCRRKQEGKLYKCDNPPCCRPSHLFLGTAKDNVDDMILKERNLKGEDDPMAKLTEEEVEEIKRVYEFGSRTLGSVSLGRRFGVHHSVIQGIVKGTRWRHVK